ncbi:E3 ubiquitin-protein ligase RSL1-like [Silene latifolia]|uniref:E3 ubiquitin-protein ligase RSL1-like n=1 Tax=Silene latifolia TaxID=37657 RepID=UPI003D771178
MEDDHDLKTLISFQRQELMAAKLHDSDLDIAFNLQMQEAMAASQALSPQPPPPLPLLAEESPSSSVHFSDAMLLEIEKYEQEQRDFEQSKLEMKKIKQNLSIQLHDHKFASEIVQFPENDWQKYGDNFENPYCSSSVSSSSNSSDVSLGIECFRVYFKGILDFDGREKVAAIGVAICDPRDNLIFEVSKPVIDVNEGELNGERVEFEGLIAGLDAAMALELKRIEYFCDDFLFFQAVSGWRQPTDRSIANIIDRVNLLQKQFVQCSPSLIARSDVKFAFRLARSSLSSQLVKLASSSSGKKETETCSICFEDRVSKLMFSVDRCRHRFCSFCMEQHLETKLLDGSLPKCPSEGCKSGIPIERCRKLLSPKLLDIMSQRVKEDTIPAAEKVYCPNPKCSMLMSISEVNEYTWNTFVRYQENGSSRCIKCHGLFCASCKVPWHSSRSCHSFQQYIQNNSNNLDTKLKSLATEKSWPQCPQCANVIELAEGCYHITCRCGFEFCYICGAAWKNKKQTCKCRLWDEPNIIRGRNVRQR